MRKLTLDMDALTVESFETSGGVVGHNTGVLECVEYSGSPETCEGGGQPTLATCNGMASCPKTACGSTCMGTCETKCGPLCFSYTYCPNPCM